MNKKGGLVWEHVPAGRHDTDGAARGDESEREYLDIDIEKGLK